MDDAAVYALVGSIVTGFIGGAVAVVTTVINSRTERTKSAQISIAEARRAELDVKDERITLRDEQLAACEREKADLRAELDRART